MKMRSDTLFARFGTAPAKVELELRLPDGSPWRLTFSAGMERFVGYYPRLDGIDPGGPLLRFQVAHPA